MDMPPLGTMGNQFLTNLPKNMVSLPSSNMKFTDCESLISLLNSIESLELD